MFRNFFELRDELLAKGATFDQHTLPLLAYRDLIRAAVGDAQAAACSAELVEAEQRHRLEAAEGMTPEERAEEGLGEDYLAWGLQQKMVALPAFQDLSPMAQLYFRLRCLRSHVDAPKQRLEALLDLLPLVPFSGPGLPALRGIIEVGARSCLEALARGETLDLRSIRRVFQGTVLLLDHLSPWERVICTSLTIQGYTCTAGCFLPVTSEG